MHVAVMLDHFEFGLQVVIRSFDRCMQQAYTGFQARHTHHGVGCAKHHFVNAFFAGHSGLAESHFKPGLRVQFNHNVFKHVGRVSAFTHTQQEAARLTNSAAVVNQTGGKAVNRS